MRLRVICCKSANYMGGGKTEGRNLLLFGVSVEGSIDVSLSFLLGNIVAIWAKKMLSNREK